MKKYLIYYEAHEIKSKDFSELVSASNGEEGETFNYKILSVQE